MERTKILALDFSGTAPVAEDFYAFCGDMQGNVIELSVTPELSEKEILLCSFMKDGVIYETLVVTNNRLVLPASVLSEAGNYSVSFAVADMQSRLTSSLQLNLSVAKDRLYVSPSKDIPDSQSFASFLLTLAQSSAAEAESRLQGELDTFSENAQAAFSAMQGEVSGAAAAAKNAQSDIDNLKIGSRNLLLNSFVAYTRDRNTTGYENKIFNVTDGVDLQSLINRQVILSAYFDCAGEKADLEGSSNGNRFGCYLSVTWNDSTGALSNTTYSYCTSLLRVYSADKKRMSATVTLMPPNGYDRIHSMSCLVQLYVKPSESNDCVWSFSNPKLEIGNRATDWSPAPEDTLQELSKKVDKTAEANTVYATDASGNQITIGYSYAYGSGLKDKVVIRDSRGHIKDCAPTQGDDVANKNYVDNAIDSLELQKGNGNPSGFGEFAGIEAFCQWQKTGKVCEVYLAGWLGGQGEYTVTLPESVPAAAEITCMSATVYILSLNGSSSSEHFITVQASSLFGTEVRFTAPANTPSSSAAIIKMTYLAAEAAASSEGGE